MGSRILPAAADELRTAIREAGDNEVFAIGDCDGTSVTGVSITCRGQSDRVVALLDRPRPGQVVIHNHPSGDLTPSNADMQLASRYGEAGIGVVIVDNEVMSANWVVEPHIEQLSPLEPERVREFFEAVLPRIMSGFEPRPQQIEMALAVTHTLNERVPLIVEAGTGTGKSLAYLIPSALWALQNDRKVVISTFTRTLQNQLLQADIPLIHHAGIEARVEVLQGRNNYLCKRRLGLALAESTDEPQEHALYEALGGWSETTSDGSRLDLPVGPTSTQWERVMSDTDLTLRARCAQYGSCHYYVALRRAAAAHVVIVNHALLMADLQMRSEIGRGILPKFDRLVLDEAHHIEDAATGAASSRCTAESIRRAILPLMDSKRRRGALGRISRDHLKQGSKLSLHAQDDLESAIMETEGRALAVVRTTEDALASVAALLPNERSPLRIDAAFTQTDDWTDWIRPTLANLALELEQTAEQLESISTLLQDVELTEGQMEPPMDVLRARRRLQGHVDTLRSFLAPPAGRARWVEAASRRKSDTAAIAWAPVDMAPTLREILWEPIKAVVATSATLAVNKQFTHWKTRVGATESTELNLPSPFDHFNQALLGLPRDLAEPNTPLYLKQTAAAILRAVEISGGGAFVLCTSYAAVKTYTAALRTLGRFKVLAQGETERTQMLSRFISDPNAVLVGTDSFWEGVSVKGQGLRLVILPRIPFRVPTDPLHAARREHIDALGQDSFRTYELPGTILRLRQGYGRLIRSHTDKGTVLLLDTRIHSRRYGHTILAALPPARRLKGPSSWIEGEMSRFYRSISDSESDPLTKS